MKAKIEPGDNDWFITFTPEDESEYVELGVMLRFMERYSHHVTADPIAYMQPHARITITKAKYK